MMDHETVTGIRTHVRCADYISDMTVRQRMLLFLVTGCQATCLSLLHLVLRQILDTREKSDEQVLCIR